MLAEKKQRGRRSGGRTHLGEEVATRVERALEFEQQTALRLGVLERSVDRRLRELRCRVEERHCAIDRDARVYLLILDLPITVKRQRYGEWCDAGATNHVDDELAHGDLTLDPNFARDVRETEREVRRRELPDEPARCAVYDLLYQPHVLILHTHTDVNNSTPGTIPKNTHCAKRIDVLCRDPVQCSDALGVVPYKCVIRRPLQQPRQRWVRVLLWWRARLSVQNKLDQHQLLECLVLQRSGGLCGRSDHDLEKLLRLAPPFERTQRDTARVVVQQVIVVMQLTQRGVDVYDRRCEER